MMYKLPYFLLALVGISAALTPGHGTIIKHEGKPVGHEVVHKNTTYYLSGKKSKTAVLFLTDVFGIELPENKLLADSFGRAGYFTIMPDLFDGKPAPADIVGDPDFNVTEFLYNHRPEITDPKIEKAIDYIYGKLGVHDIVATGYCFGGRYAFRLLNGDQGVSVGFAAHPSLLEDSEINAITGPVSVAAAEVDERLTPEQRFNLEKLLTATGETYSISLYSGTQHGFAVRANISDPQQKFGKEEAFFQAVRFFDAWA